MKLSSLIRGMEILEVWGDPDVEVSSLCYNSRDCRPGAVFVAIRGLKSDGHDFLNEALARGATAVVHEGRYSLPPAQAAIRVKDSRLSLGIMAANFFSQPSRKLKLIGITGTNGKTTVTYLLESILKAAGREVGVIGTINYRYGGRVFPAPHTTPESYEFQRLLAEMAEAGVAYVLAEVSSHALDLKRVDAAVFKLGIFTNLSQDHLDYHKSMERYYQAKKRLFSEMLPAGQNRQQAWAIINADDSWGRRLLEEVAVPVVTFGLTPASQVYAASHRLSLEGIAAKLKSPQGAFEIKSALIGRHNLENILAAAAAALALGIEPRDISKGVAELTCVPGRLERVSRLGEPAVFVDYAHTEDALLKVLGNLEQYKKGKIITLFGCGGDRDRGKRPKMGRAATQGSDLTVITSDNPRSEDPAKIIAEIEAGINRRKVRKIDIQSQDTGGRAYLIIEDRRQAIAWAIRQAEPSDIVLIAGKGHEDYQIIGGQRLHFDDRREARAALEARSYALAGPGECLENAKQEEEELRLTAKEVLAATGGRLLWGDAEQVFCGISTDTRSLERGNLFVPLAGARFDGHDFIDQAAALGASGYLCRSGAENPRRQTTAGVAIEVPDTLVALGDLAGYWRRKFSVSVLAITGSCGKTTTKEMAAAILALARPTLKTTGNYNNLIGLPLTVFRLRAYHKFAVLELGMNVRGEIGRLTWIARPEVGLITNVGPAHLENLGSLEMIREEKGDLFRMMQHQGTAVINLDDEAVRTLAARWQGRRVTFSLESEADVVARDLVLTGNAGAEFTLRAGGDSVRVRLAAPGLHQVRNALAAAASAWACGISLELIGRGLSSFLPASGRFCIHRLAGGINLIDDCYNANPASMKEALRTLSAIKGEKRALAVLGDMLELGPQSAKYHEELGTLAGESGIFALLLKGGFRQAIAKGARQAGLPADRIFYFDEPGQASSRIAELLAPGDWVLVKGSRGMRLEAVVSELLKEKGTVVYE